MAAASAGAAVGWASAGLAYGDETAGVSRAFEPAGGETGEFDDRDGDGDHDFDWGSSYLPVYYGPGVQSVTLAWDEFRACGDTDLDLYAYDRQGNVVGRAEVKEVFKSGKRDKAAGLLVEEGVIRKGLHARLTREDVIVSATTIASLRCFKDDVDEVRAGLECGVVLADTNDIKPGDQLEAFEV